MTQFISPDVRSFLERFSEAGRNADADAQRGYWAETFLTLDPSRATAVPREAMLAALPQRRKLFESIGATASELVDAEETPLDGQHTLVQTTWRWRLTAGQDGEAELTMKSTFLLRREGSQWTIVVYLNHQDVAAIIAERASRVGEKA